MVSLELLSSLDGLIWLQSGTKVGELFHQHQTTVSRNLKKCSEVFGLSIYKQNSFWLIEGDCALLNLERAVHQSARLQGKSPLRLEVNGWSNSVLFPRPPTGWVASTSQANLLQPGQTLQLLRDNIIDAWLCLSPEAPQESEDFCVVDLCEAPIQFLVAPGHPLLECETINFELLKSYPFQRGLLKSLPGTVARLKKSNLWTQEHDCYRYPQLDRADQQAVSLTLHLDPLLANDSDTSDLVPLPISLKIKTGISLVYKHSLGTNNQGIQSLSGYLRRQLRLHQSKHPSLQLLPDGAPSGWGIRGKSRSR